MGNKNSKLKRSRKSTITNKGKKLAEVLSYNSQLNLHRY